MDTFETNNNWNEKNDSVEEGRDPVENNEAVEPAFTQEPAEEFVREPDVEPMTEPRQEQSAWQSYQQDAWSYPGNRPKPPKAPKEKKSYKGSGRIVAVALVCASLGGVGGGAIMSAVSANRFERQTQAIQQQINDLKGSASGDKTILTSVSAQGLKSGAQIYAENVDAVVSVNVSGVTTTQYGNQNFESRGTGFLISQDGYILTNHHVIDGAKDITVVTNDGEKYAADLIGSDAYYDVALLKIEGEDLPYVTIGDSSNTVVGEEVVAIGNALGELSSSFTGGYLSGVNRMVNSDGTSVSMLQTDAAINSGNSGGPLFNMKGEVIGITSAKYSGQTSSGAYIEGIGFAIPINDVMDLVDDLRDYGYVTGQAYLGVRIQNLNIDESLAAAYGLPMGVQVASVDEGGAAEKAGIQVNDIITALGDTKVTSYDELAAALRQRKAGQTDTITVYRSGQERVLTITFDEKQVVAPGETEPETPEATQGNNGETPNLPGQNDSWDQWYDFFYRYFGGGR